MITTRTRVVVLHRHDEAVQPWHQFPMAAEQRKGEAGSAHRDAVQVVW
jgi:hypothetical protein